MSNAELTPNLELLLQAMPASFANLIVYCPEERSQLGDVFESSEAAFAAAKRHNQTTGHTATIAPVFNAAAQLGGVENLPWPFCFRYNGNSWWSTVVWAPSPGDAALSAQALAQWLNTNARQLRLQALFSASSGACPTT